MAPTLVEFSEREQRQFKVDERIRKYRQRQERMWDLEGRIESRNPVGGCDFVMRVRAIGRGDLDLRAA